MDPYLEAIKQERIRQDEIWGDQRRHTNLEWLAITTEELGEVAMAVCDQDVNLKTLPIVDEQIRKELIQTAAVCVAWLESIDLRKSRNPGSIAPCSLHGLRAINEDGHCDKCLGKVKD